MMKCKRHPREQGAGVCASCLRDRLLALQASRNGLLPESHCRHPPPPVLFPRSASPYASHRLSVDSDAASDASAPGCRRRRRRFYHTPQVGDRGSGRIMAHGCRRFPLFSSLFHRQRHHGSGSDESEVSDLRSWFSSLIHGKNKEKKKEKKMKTRSISSPPATKKVASFVVSDRGMSPARVEETDDNASESGYSTDSTATWRRRTPARPPSLDRHRRNGGGFVGFTVCLSPLARPGPTSRRKQTPDTGFSGELRSNGNPIPNRHVSGAGGSFGPNRSRKLADPGRFR